MVARQMYERYTQFCEAEEIIPVGFSDFADQIVDYFVDKAKQSILVKDEDMHLTHFGVTRINDEVNLIISFDKDANFSIIINDMSLDDLTKMLSNDDEYNVIVN